jgi:hypothetical protein
MSSDMARLLAAAKAVQERVATAACCDNIDPGSVAPVPVWQLRAPYVADCISAVVRWEPSLGPEVCVEQGEAAFPAVGGRDGVVGRPVVGEETVARPRVDDDLGLRVVLLQLLAELSGVGGWWVGVALPVEAEERRLDVLDQVEPGHLGGGIRVRAGRGPYQATDALILRVGAGHLVNGGSPPGGSRH